MNSSWPPRSLSRSAHSATRLQLTSPALQHRLRQHDLHGAQGPRAGGDIDPSVLTNILRESAEKNAHRKQLLQIIENHPVLSDRDMLFRNYVERYNFGIEKVFNYVKLLEDRNITDPEDRQILYSPLGEPTDMDVHWSMFIPTLENQATKKQQKKWLDLARNFKILGAYAQTELGHGLNVQGINITAHFDKSTQEFVINSPTLTSRK